MNNDIIDAEIIESTDETVEASEAGAKIDEIVIMITEANASYKSSLPPHEIVFWLDVMKHMILGNLIGGTPPGDLTDAPG